jgi:endonuclease YncB( thermonuclease family)
MNQPPIGYTTEVELVKVIDGDTLRVKIEKEFVVRLQDFNAPETRKPAQEEEIKEGFKYKKCLQDIVENKKLVLFVPGHDNIAEIFSIGARLIGNIYVDGTNVVDLIKERMGRE